MKKYGYMRQCYYDGHFTHFRIDKKNNKLIDGKWVPKKEPSKMFKYTEFIIDEWLKAEEKGQSYIVQQDGPCKAEGLRPMQWLEREYKKAEIKL